MAAKWEIPLGKNLKKAKKRSKTSSSDMSGGAGSGRSKRELFELQATADPPGFSHVLSLPALPSSLSTSSSATAIKAAEAKQQELMLRVMIDAERCRVNRVGRETSTVSCIGLF
jgi:hypothetical protein